MFLNYVILLTVIITLADASIWKVPKKSRGKKRVGVSEDNITLQLEFHDERATFLEANRICGQNGSLAFIRCEEDAEILYDDLEKTYEEGSSFWINGYNGFSQIEWVNLQDFEEIEFTNWLPGRPTEKGENCMEAVMKNGELFTNDNECSSLTRFICEKEIEQG